MNSGGPARLQYLPDAGDSTHREQLALLWGLAHRGLREMRRPNGGLFPYTAHARGTGLDLVGTSLRYSAVVALGARRLSADEQTALLGRDGHHLLVADMAPMAERAADLGATALCAWAAAEATYGPEAESLLTTLRERVSRADDIPVVDLAWALTALVAGADVVPLDGIADDLAARLADTQSQAGLFPHRAPAASSGRLRAHVACFADQVYPLQALARYSVVTGDQRALAAADSCAARICALQGSEGQWWWHYDVRSGTVVEGFPVYSVHQHAMAPMALFDLLEAGGTDHRREVATGLAWLGRHPETDEELVDAARGVVWRKVARTDRLKVVRRVRSVASAVRRDARVSLLDSVFPPGWVDRECRPYELGWLLYAWSSDRPVPVGDLSTRDSR